VAISAEAKGEVDGKNAETFVFWELGEGLMDRGGVLENR
jgi:hypothetical protein